MATSVETMWVADEAQLQETVRTLVVQGGKVQTRAPGEVRLLLAKKLNLWALILGLVACIVPGLVYLIWYLLADADQDVTVRIGTPPTVRTEHQLWPDDVDGPPPTPAPDVEPSGFGRRDPARPDPLPYPADPDATPIAEFPAVPSPPPPPAPPTS